MARYSQIPKIRSNNTNITSTQTRRLYANVKYPEIPLSENDIYITTRRGDGLDDLALRFYNQKDDWWIISIANPNIPQNSLYPPIGTQLRIPNNPSQIKANFENLNRNV